MKGHFLIRTGRWFSRGINQGVDTHAGITVPFDGYVNLDGEPLQYSSRPELRPFNGKELKAILRVGQCVGCHDSYGDEIWKQYTQDTVCKRTGEDSSEL